MSNDEKMTRQEQLTQLADQCRLENPDRAKVLYAHAAAMATLRVETAIGEGRTANPDALVLEAVSLWALAEEFAMAESFIRRYYGDAAAPSEFAMLMFAVWPGEDE